jgi:peroxiredoxin
MTATLYLIGCVLATAQPAPAAPAARGGDWLLVTRLTRGQELVYRGIYTEEARGGHAQFNRAYRLEARAFVLETPPRGAEVALLTVLRRRDPRPGVDSGSDAAPSSVRLERALVDLQGRLIAPGVSLTVPLEGPPLLERGAFVETPTGRLGVEQTWDVAETGRPLQVWRNSGSEMVNGTLCLKLQGQQQSQDWDRPRADRTAWRRRDTVWLAARLGVAYRVERVIERRGPADAEPTQWGKLRYELDSSMQVPAPLAEDRRREIAQALAVRSALTPLLAQPTAHVRELTNLIKKIEYFVENEPPTPYRDAVLQVKRRAEAARRGETPAAGTDDTQARATPTVATVGELAPDFVAADLSGSGSARPRRWLDRPVLFVFYNPASPTAADVLRFAQRVHQSYADRVAVVGLAVGSPAQVKAQREELGVTFTILDGSGMRISYAVETTPKFVVLDGANIVRGAWLGWGRETPGEVVEEVKRWLSVAGQLPPTPVKAGSP